MMLTIAMDGPAASGKGSVGRRLAEKLGLHYLDTGLLYRALGLATHQAGLDCGKENEVLSIMPSIALDQLDPVALGAHQVGMLASKVAVHPQVRTGLLALQRDFASREPGTILDGRDIASVVLPDASVKFYVTADLAERARRRHADAVREKPELTMEEVAKDIMARDDRDMNRPTAPLRQVAGAILLDTTHLSIDEAVAQALQHVLSHAQS